MKSKIQKLNFLFFILLPFIDLITALITRHNLFSISIGVIVKSLYMLIILFYILFYSKSKYRKTFIKYIISILIFVFLYTITKPHILNIHSLINEYINLYKFFFLGYLFFAYLVLNDDFKYDNKFYTNIMLYTAVVYSLLMIIPYITKTGYVTYPHKPNLGTIGWFYSANEVSAIFLMLLPYFFLKLKKIDKKNKYIFMPLIAPIIFSIFIIGTKVSWYGGVILVLLLTIIMFIKNKKDIKFNISMLLVLIVMILLNFVSPTTTNLNGTLDSVYNKKNNQTTQTNKTRTTNEQSVSTTATTTTNANNNDNSVVQSSTVSTKKEQCGTYHKLNEVIKNRQIYRIINISLSGRQNRAYTLFLIYKDSNIFDKFLGVGFTNNDKINSCHIENVVEMDFIDAILHYGIIGFILIVTPFIYLIKNIKIKEQSLESLVYMISILFILLLSFISGHIIGYPASSIYLVLLMITHFNLIREGEK